MFGVHRRTDNDNAFKDDKGVVMLAWFYELMSAFASLLLSVLPTSPFQQYIQAFAEVPYLGILNWFIPIGAFIKIGAAWLGAIALFYLYSIVMRWVKMIGD